MTFKIFLGTVLVCLLFISACEDQGDPVTPVIPPSNNPTIGSIVPDSAAVGDTVAINGTDFGSTQGTGTVAFGSVNAAIILSWSDTQIIVVVPANSVTGNVRVTVGNGTSNAAQFKVIGSVATVSFATDILQNIFRKTAYGCTGCHGPTNNLFLDSYVDVMRGNSTRGPVVVLGDTNSLLIRKLKGGSLLGPTEGDRMPFGGTNPIANADLRNVVTWIKEGAQDNELIDMDMKKITLLFFIAALCAAAQEKKEKVSFSEDVKPVFVKKCLNCHNTEDESPSGLYLEEYEQLMKGESRHGPVVKPKKGEESILIQKLRGTAEFGKQMPRGRKPLDDETIEMISRWIDQGAKNN